MRRVILFIYIIFLTTNAWAVETIKIEGAGPSTKVVSKFFEAFNAQPEHKKYTFIVPWKSIKHKGGS